MNDLPIEFHINRSRDILTRHKTRMSEVLEESGKGFNVKYQLIDIIAALEVELTFVTEVLEAVDRERKSKKFWQFWK
jgi:hypothetical protein